jgi:hypothetical protein
MYLSIFYLFYFLFYIYFIFLLIYFYFINFCYYNGRGQMRGQVQLSVRQVQVGPGHSLGQRVDGEPEDAVGPLQRARQLEGHRFGAVVAERVTAVRVGLSK